MMREAVRTLVRGKVLVGILGVCLLVIGSVGIFVSTSGVPTTAAIVSGAVMVLLSALVDRILLIKYGPYEIHLARDYFAAAETAEEEGADTTAGVLRERAWDVLQRSERGDLPYGSTIRKLYAMAREAITTTVREAFEAEGLKVERGLQTLISQFALEGVRGEKRVGVLITVAPWDVETGLAKIRVGLHSTPGLRGVLVVQQMMGSRRTGGLPEPSIADVERNVELHFQGLRVRIVSWRQGDSSTAIREAVQEILGVEDDTKLDPD